MDENNAYLYIVGYILAFIVGVFITRAIFSIPKFLKYQRMQVLLLVELAKAKGVDPDRIEKIKKDLILLED